MADVPGSGEARYVAAIEAIDKANSQDVVAVEVGGERVPKELAHSRRMTEWVHRLDPGATDLQFLAARAHHLRRWEVPRDSYDEGRTGYLRWRNAQKKRHAEEVAELLVRCGYTHDEAARVGAIIRKENLGRDPQVQTHEDALCLVFIELQFAEVTEQLGDDHMVEVVRKTLRKMSPAAIDVAVGLPLDPRSRAVLMRAAS